MDDHKKVYDIHLQPNSLVRIIPIKNGQSSQFQPAPSVPVNASSQVENQIQIIINRDNGEKFSLLVNPQMQILQLKQMVSARIGIADQFIYLIYGGNVLKDDYSIEQSKIYKGSNIQMILRFGP
jgi:hypothetical protein